ncbi:DUF4870 domain-containing protein [Spongiivirga sp. MCCC 1A20706]|uniref:DUF4870 domain-containing protein n=1 Tax=Spongiivirga sp. MCCC 1A20706 TaxID=3160963 RepID=UPI003977E2F3
MREDNNLIVIMHLTGLFFGILGPLIFWVAQKDHVKGMDEHGKAAINFHIGGLILTIIVIALSFFCIGFLLLPFLVLYLAVFPIVSSINASKGAPSYYPIIFTIIH